MKPRTEIIAGDAYTIKRTTSGVHFDSRTGCRPIRRANIPQNSNCEDDEKYLETKMLTISAHVDTTRLGGGFGISLKDTMVKTSTSRKLRHLWSDWHPVAETSGYRFYDSHGFSEDVSENRSRQTILDPPDLLIAGACFAGALKYRQGDYPKIPPFALRVTSKLIDRRPVYHLNRLPTIDAGMSLIFPDFTEALHTGIANNFECSIRSNFTEDLAIQKGGKGSEAQWMVANRHRNSIITTCEERYRGMFHAEEFLHVVGGDERGLSRELFFFSYCS